LHSHMGVSSRVMHGVIADAIYQNSVTLGAFLHAIKQAIEPKSPAYLMAEKADVIMLKPWGAAFRRSVFARDSPYRAIVL